MKVLILIILLNLHSLLDLVGVTFMSLRFSPSGGGVKVLDVAACFAIKGRWLT